MRRKGELSAAGIDSGWPFQVAVADPQDDRERARLADAIHVFCKDRALSKCDRGHSVLAHDRWYRVHCFADPEHAAMFMQRFGGEAFNPADRGKGRAWAKWNRKA